MNYFDLRCVLAKTILLGLSKVFYHIVLYATGLFYIFDDESVISRLRASGLFHQQTDRHFYLTSEKIGYQGEENDRKIFETSSPAKYKSNCTEDE